MRLSDDDCWDLVRSAEHGVLCTAGARGAIDAVPVCFALVSTSIVTPVDTVKPKRTTGLVRLKNLDRDPTATLLCEHWNLNDWSQLWWVRAHLVRRSVQHVGNALLEESERALREKYAQYRDTDFAELVLLDVKTFVGWSAAGVHSERPEGTVPLV